MKFLFVNPVIVKALFFILENKKCYPSQLKTIFQSPLSSFQRALAVLEKGGIIISRSEGTTIIYEFNTRYPFLNKLESFLEKAYEALPEEIKEKYYELKIRKRPRRQAKPF